ncbi:unnamed protein product [Nezara viridula]|uniref:Uncharacterized protein n=1 Tax=Nezara viridula TaxID=85310 RepID=A0A9P0HQK6_NEZVI|nr:unnamed protein product [Nezara viridula]
MTHACTRYLVDRINYNVEIKPYDYDYVEDTDGTDKADTIQPLPNPISFLLLAPSPLEEQKPPEGKLGRSFVPQEPQRRGLW